MRGLLKAMRPHQWTKNLLLWVPLLLAHQVNIADPAQRARMIATLWSFVAFCLVASAAYVLNDLCDLEADRLHPTKRRRPFASGAVPTRLGPLLFISLLIAGFGVGIGFLSVQFAVMVAVYFAMTVAYSLYFKKKLLVDVMILAGLYTWRILAGKVAADVTLTPWMLAFSMFFFLSLAFAKRYTELMGLVAAQKTQTSRRAYLVDDLTMIPPAGLAAGYMSVLVFSLYIHDGQAVRGLYQRPYLLWLICPILLYWITRLWFIARRGALSEDPVVFAIEDRVSWLAGALCVTLVVTATVPHAYLPLLP